MIETRYVPSLRSVRKWAINVGFTALTAACGKAAVPPASADAAIKTCQPCQTAAPAKVPTPPATCEPVKAPFISSLFSSSGIRFHDIKAYTNIPFSFPFFYANYVHPKGDTAFPQTCRIVLELDGTKAAEISLTMSKIEKRQGGFFGQQPADYEMDLLSFVPTGKVSVENPGMCKVKMVCDNVSLQFLDDANFKVAPGLKKPQPVKAPVQPKKAPTPATTPTHRRSSGSNL